ncbi:MAG: hypothetical protein RIT43_1103 [Bacteroidota bacterium]
MVSAMLLASISWTQSIITKWDFNSSINDATTSTGTIAPSFGSGTLTPIGGITQSFATGNSADLNTTDNSGCQTTGYPATGTSPKTAGVQFDIPTTGFNKVVLEFYQRLSNSAANTWVLQYTLDNTGVSTGGNVIWADAAVYTFTPAATGTGDTWYFRSFDFSAVTALGNNPNAGFRIVSDFDPVTGNYVAAKLGNSYATNGTSRFDLVTLREPSGTASILAANNYQAVSESVGTINVPVNFSNGNNAAALVAVSLSSYSSTTNDQDIIFNDTLTVPALTNGSVNLTVTINQDIESERTETAILKISALNNATVSSVDNYAILYIKDDDYAAPLPTNEIKLQLLSSFSNGSAGTNSAEIVAHDPTTQRLYVANSIGSKLDIINFANPSSPQLINSVSMAPYGNINSVTAYNGYLALAIESIPSQGDGSVVILDANGTFINQVTVGAMPDMIAFNNSHTKLFTANEGEPGPTYSIDPLLNVDLMTDPKGSVSIIDLTPGYAALTNANVTTLTFDSFNGQEAALRNLGIRIFSSAASVSQDLEPEYITISDDDSKIFVSLQENNAMAVIDVATSTIDSLVPLGYADYTAGNGMDASDQTTGQVLISSLPIQGAYMPDAIKYANIGGNGYVFSANEGDSREFGGVVDAARINTLSLDSTVFPDQHILKNNRYLGRLSALKFSEDTDGDGDIDQLHAMGSRSYSVWNAQTGQLVFDSKDLIERIISQTPPFAAIFNASNSTGVPSLKNRSDDKGPEPEGITHAVFNGHNYLFVSLERIGGVMIFNVDIPSAPYYVGYANNRNTTSSGPDLGPEGIIFIDADNSPTGQPLLLLANEISSTLSIYAVKTCAELAGAVIESNTNEICSGENLTLQILGSAGTEVQWFQDGSAITGATLNALTVDQTGAYSLSLQSDLYACVDTTNEFLVTVHPLPPVQVTATENVICSGDSVALQVSGADTYSWLNPGVIENNYFFPVETETYVVIGTDVNGCSNSSNVLVTVNARPNVIANVSDNEVCEGQNVLFYGSGAQTYTWNNNIVNGLSTNNVQSGIFQVIGTDLNGCLDTAEISLTVNPIPAFQLGNDTLVCESHLPVELSGPSGYTDYFWSNGSGTINTEVNYQGSFTLTVTDANGCEGSDEIFVTVDGCLGVDNIESISLTLYPNPASDEVHVIGTLTGKFELIDVLGKVILEGSKNQENITISLDQIPSGLYTLRVWNSRVTSENRVLKF